MTVYLTELFPKTVSIFSAKKSQTHIKQIIQYITMIYRRFGKTELAMPVLSFGCMRSMHGWTDSPLEKIPSTANDTLETIVRTALGHGINHIETAHGYGS